MSCPSGLKHFKHACCTLAGAHAHRDDAVLGVLGFQFIQELHGEFGPSATQGVSKGDGTTVHIDFGGIQVQFTEHRQTLRSKGFVQFIQLDVGGRLAGFFERLGHGVDGADTHDARLEPTYVVRFQSRQRLHA